tara:strand:- start:53 stop:487 length:435 start_codon:yes stop_codon:yes gene_type:complete
MDKINVAIGSDHAGFELKEFILNNLGETINFEDFGTDSKESCDFPDYAASVSEFVVNNSNYKGILICGTGVGMSIAANKYEGIRAANVTDIKTAVQCVEHNDANILCLGANNVSQDLSIEIINNFLSSALIEEEKYIQRINKIK